MVDSRAASRYVKSLLGLAVEKNALEYCASVTCSCFQKCVKKTGHSS